MSGKTYVVVGGVAGGAGAAARLRRLDEDATIILYEKGPYVSFANCGLPYYAGGVIQDRERLLVTPPATFTDVFGIQLHTDTEVTAIDPKGKTVTVKGKDGKEQKQAYDALVLSPGAKPFVPPLPGVDDPAVLTVRNIPDIDRVVATMKKAKKAVVVGGGFIGLEMAENLSEKGIAVTLVEAAPQCMTPLDYDMAVFVHQALRSHGVELRLSSPLQKIVRTGDTVQVVLPDKTISDVDLVILSIGVMPDSHLAKEAGLSVDAKGISWSTRSSRPAIRSSGPSGTPSPFLLRSPENRGPWPWRDRPTRWRGCAPIPSCWQAHHPIPGHLRRVGGQGV
jgi:NADPH-dependent 2,4-dienoyl-CoA reductase/sulfur reductase-like enzyme